MDCQIGKIYTCTMLMLLIGLSSAVIAEEVRRPLQPVFEKSVLSSWLQKEVLKTRSLVNMDAPPALPDNVKVVMQFSFHERAKVTEVKIRTRIFALDTSSKRKMIIYWGVIKFGIWLFRKSWLSAIKRRAENY